MIDGRALAAFAAAENFKVMVIACLLVGGLMLGFGFWLGFSGL